MPDEASRRQYVISHCGHAAYSLRMTARHALRCTALTAAFVLGATFPLTAPAGGVPDDVVQAAILGGWTTGNGTRMAALHLKLAPGWKTYWRAPGDSGIPPSFNWSASDNLRGVSYHWPRPEVFTSYGVRSIGYEDELVLPIELHPNAPGEEISLHGEIDLGVCETICMPARVTVQATLNGDGQSDPAIHQALADRPRPANRAGVGRVTCDLEPISDGLRLEAEIDMPRLPGEEVAMIEAGDPRIWVSEPEVSREGDALLLVADLVSPNGKPMALDRSAIRFTVIAGTNAVDIRGCKSR